jgi:hypothetical protein
MFRRPLSYFQSRFHPKQELAWLAYKAGKSLVLPWGRRSGKSDLFAEIQIEDAETSGYPQLFVAKTQKQARSIIWPKLHRRLVHEPGWKVHEQRLEISYKNGPFIAIKGADLRPDELAGGAYRTIACDERALWSKPETKQLILAPMLADYDGLFLDGSTKRGKNHFYKEHMRALKDPLKYFCVEATMFDNPFISRAGREKIISEYPGGEENPLYRQEILNEYVVFEGQVFALDEEQYVETIWDPADLDHSLHWRCLDHGYSPDPTACLWMAYNPRKGYFQIHNEYRQPALLIHQHADAINRIERRRFQGSYSDIDPQVVAEYGAVGLELTNAIKGDKQARLLAVVNALRSGRLKIASHLKMLLDEMQSYSWDQDHNDDLVDALSMLWASASQLPEESPHTHTEEVRHRKEHLDGHYQSFDD